MIPVTDLRAGRIFKDQGQIFMVLTYEHIKLGRGSANIKVKVRNVRSGATTEKSFINGARVLPIQILKRDLQFLYKDGDACYFMHPETFEQFVVPLSKLPDHTFLKEGDTFSLSFLDDEFIELNLPPKMAFKIEETGPSLRGNSATNIYKDAVLENGLKVKVPLFIKIGESVRIDTKTKSYSEKV